MKPVIDADGLYSYRHPEANRLAQDTLIGAGYTFVDTEDGGARWQLLAAPTQAPAPQLSDWCAIQGCAHRAAQSPVWPMGERPPYADVHVVQAPAPAPAPGDEGVQALAKELVRMAGILRDCGRFVSKSGNGELVMREAAAALAALPATQVPEGWTADEIADACVEADIPDSKFERLLLALAAAPQRELP